MRPQRFADLVKPQRFLIADPQTGVVVRRARDAGKLSERHLCALPVSLAVWKSYRAGQEVEAVDIGNADTQDRWIKRRAFEMSRTATR